MGFYIQPDCYRIIVRIFYFIFTIKVIAKSQEDLLGTELG